MPMRPADDSPMTPSADRLDVVAIWREFHGALRAFARKHVSDPDEVQDLIQEVFCQIQRSKLRETEVEHIGGWVFRITRNAIIDRARRKTRRRGTLEKAQQAGALEAAAEADASEHALAGVESEPEKTSLLCALRPFLAELPKAQREAIELTDLGQLSQAEAARRLGLSPSGLKSRVQRGRARLRELIVDCCHVELDGRGGIVDVQKRDNGKPCAC
ncbi:MAG: sigma-70 family RNA polymerase sigma factor [Myxococcales bacterium FL481]|nr:MAG: sigma-70 family RNA polymerase sigma factor [Myxococcales bacterium FL481]